MSFIPQWKLLERRVSGLIARSRKWPPEQTDGAVGTGTNANTERSLV